MADITLWRDILDISEKVAKKFNLTYGKIQALTEPRAHYYGNCSACPRCVKANHIDPENCREKIIKIRLHVLKNKKKALSQRTILRTLAHELAHCKIWNHGPEHDHLTEEIITCIKDLGHTI